MTQHGKKSRRPKAPGQRQLRVGEELRHALADILLRGECHDPRLDGASITVSEVRIGPDLKHATVYVMPLAGANKEALLEVLNAIAPHLRSLLGRKRRPRPERARVPPTSRPPRPFASSRKRGRPRA